MWSAQLVLGPPVLLFSMLIWISMQLMSCPESGLSGDSSKTTHTRREAVKQCIQLAGYEAVFLERIDNQVFILFFLPSKFSM
ncbi:hypothetical protein DFH94DRAFT_770227 [Russula ochroleuca]|uniref:Uncharacterized protein n=1 Tax=Russula ochroleuca TaxID=152965 RepID=A0A9P5JYS1_9AGAM|nr:hypothetical protein DFH94DRAFT_770227 [Russula ochroleuca]